MDNYCKCKTCMGCNKEEDLNFAGTNECENYRYADNKEMIYYGSQVGMNN